MSTTIIGAFPSYEDAQNAIQDIREHDNKSKIVIMNRLPRIKEENQSPKLDGVISGVSDVFIGAVPFVNPMASFLTPLTGMVNTAGMPPLHPPELNENSRNFLWSQFGVDERGTEHIQSLIEKGRTIVAIKTETQPSQIQSSFSQHHGEEISHFQL